MICVQRQVLLSLTYVNLCFTNLLTNFFPGSKPVFYAGWIRNLFVLPKCTICSRSPACPVCSPLFTVPNAVLWNKIDFLGYHKQYPSAKYDNQTFILSIQSSTNIIVASYSYSFINTKILKYKALPYRTKIGNSIVTLSSSIIHHVKHLCLNFKLSFWHLFDTRNMVILCGPWFDHWRTRWIILLNSQLFCQLRLRFLYKLSLNCWYIFVDKYIVYR